jgi:hypothetical protein
MVNRNISVGSVAAIHRIVDGIEAWCDHRLVPTSGGGQDAHNSFEDSAGVASARNRGVHAYERRCDAIAGFRGHHRIGWIVRPAGACLLPPGLELWKFGLRLA